MKPNKKTPAKFDPAGLTYSALIWGEHISGNDNEARHEVAVAIDGLSCPVSVAEMPLSTSADDMKPDGKGGSVPYASATLDQRAMRDIANHLANAASTHAQLVAACMAALPCLRGNPDFYAEEKQINSALYAAGIRHCCNAPVVP